jgi:hypothetical protein
LQLNVDISVRKHLVIAGTGRSGTSFLVRYLSALGLDTHLSRSEAWNENAQAGLEDFVLHGSDQPYVVKSPWLYEHIDQILARDDIKLDGVIIPVRDLVEASVSRVAVEMQNAYGMLPALADEVKMWETFARTPGGVVFSLNPLDQARILALGFHNLVHALTLAEIPVHLIAFPKMIYDFEYLFRTLRAVIPTDVSEDRARDVFSRLADRSKVRVSRPVPAEKAKISVAAKYPSNSSIELAALKREVKRLRSLSMSKSIIVRLASEQYLRACELLPGKDIVQRFKPVARLDKVTVKFVTFGRSPTRYIIDWQILAYSEGSDPVELGTGQLDAGDLQDWEFVDLPFAVPCETIPQEIELSLRTDTLRTPPAPVGIPFYQSRPNSAATPAMIGNEIEPTGAQIGLWLHYHSHWPAAEVSPSGD